MADFLSLAKFLPIREKLRSRGKKVVFTNGVFDLLHVGHVRLLNKARSHGDVLVVGLNSDSSVQRIKGSTRPILAEKYRAELLCALSCVDYVVLFDDETPENLISAIRPDVHVKGGDWKAADLPETKVVQSYGGIVVIENSECEITTTRLVKKIQETCQLRKSTTHD